MGASSDALNEGLRALSRFFIDESPVGDTLLRMSELACEVAPADMAGITMLVEGRPRTGVFTDPDAPDIDTAQYDNNAGPCLTAFRTTEPQRIDSTETDPRWPDFAAKAASYGIGSVLSIPIAARAEGLGALNLYSRKQAAFNDEILERTQIFADQAAVVLANVQVYWDARQLSENLRQAMESRTTIDQAIGILMANGSGSAQESFNLLVRASQRENRKLREIATEIVDRVSKRQRPNSLG